MLQRSILVSVDRFEYHRMEGLTKLSERVNRLSQNWQV